MDGIGHPGLWLGVVGAAIAAIAVAFFRRDGGDRWTAGWGYKIFVARRYLLVSDPKVRASTMRMIAIGIAARVACEVVVALGVDASNWHAPMWVLQRAIELFLLVVIVGGVVVHSRPAFYAFFVGVALFLSGIGIATAVPGSPLGPAVTFTVQGSAAPWSVIAVFVVLVAGPVLAGLAILFGCLRAFFTFFTTVPIGGVWIGTAALVCVLAVMSGFESDLRDKILGSNAHIQVTREEGEFIEWRDVKSRIDRIPGVVASTPYAVSEVVIAANSNGMNVIIKGIDPKSVGAVTDLVNDLEDKDAMQNLEPGREAELDLAVPQGPVHAGKPGKPTPPGKGEEVDPPPADLPKPGVPIDFSGSGEGTTAPSATDAPSPGSAASPRGVERLDPPPDDLITTAEPPIDFSQPDVIDEPELDIDVFDLPPDVLSPRTRALPGVLVGRELAKQTHLYTGQEVRLVSPLSDPSNPDATGTPIPFNRDYRVAGIFFTGMFEYDLKYVYVTLDSLQDFLDRGDAVDGIEVRVDAPDDSRIYVARLAAALGPTYRIQDWTDLNRSLFSALKLEKIAMFIVLGIVILVASFSIVGNLIMVVVEKAREIALLKTLGASDPGVMQLFAIQGLLIGLAGTVLGVATGLVACYFGKRVGIPLNPDVYYIDKMPVHVDPSSVLFTFLAGVSISIAATFYPAILAARIRPAIGLHH